jgi:hypothetical protein
MAFADNRNSAVHISLWQSIRCKWAKKLLSSPSLRIFFMFWSMQAQ